MEQLLRAGRGDLEHRAIDAVKTAGVHHAIEVAVLVEDQSPIGIGAVPVLEAVEHLLRAGRRDLEHRAAAVGVITIRVAAQGGRAIEVSLLVEDQAPKWTGAVRTVDMGAETVEHLLSSSGAIVERRVASPPLAHHRCIAASDPTSQSLTTPGLEILYEVIVIQRYVESKRSIRRDVSALGNI